MIRQDCEELKYISSLPFAKYACKLFACFYFAEQIKGSYFDADEIVKITDELLTHKYIDNELSVYENQFYQCKNKEYEILKLTKPNYAHFVPGDGTGNYSWDSLGIRPQQKDYRLKSKRIIKLA